MTKFAQLSNQSARLLAYAAKVEAAFERPVDRDRLIQALADCAEAAEISRRLSVGLQDWLNRNEWPKKLSRLAQDRF
jgi:hypothetical protein